MSERLGGPRLLMKRDDLTGLAMGGNKTRKLEYAAADARAQGADTLVTTGSLQSNHCRQTAAAAARIGMHCVLLLRGEEPNDLPEGNLLLDQYLGAEVRIGTQTLEEAAAELHRNGRKPYVIPVGASNAVGATAYVAAMEEALDQLRARRQHVDWMVFASGSGGTQAGLCVGARTAGFRGKILGISVSRQADVLEAQLAELANQTATYLELSEKFVPSDFHVNADFRGGGYAVVGKLERDACLQMARTEGILLDPVYTGRAFGGLTKMVAQGEFRRDETVLFWHTGGTPALFTRKNASSMLA